MPRIVDIKNLANKDSEKKPARAVSHPASHQIAAEHRSSGQPSALSHGGFHIQGVGMVVNRMKRLLGDHNDDQIFRLLLHYSIATLCGQRVEPL